jgi:hypothetical protein
MASTRWHRATYKAHAEVIKQLMNPANEEVLKKVAYELAIIYGADNANFQRDKFLTACGVK